MGSLGFVFHIMQHRFQNPNEKFHWWAAMYRELYRHGKLRQYVLCFQTLNACQIKSNTMIGIISYLKLKEHGRHGTIGAHALELATQTQDNVQCSSMAMNPALVLRMKQDPVTVNATSKEFFTYSHFLYIIIS